MTKDILTAPVGTKERPTLEAKEVEIMSVEIRPPKPDSKALITVFSCKHPDAKALLDKDEIEISQVRTENKKSQKMEIVGLWVNLDEDGNLQKGSTLANFLQMLKVKSVKECIGKKVETVQRESGFLAFKGY